MYLPESSNDFVFCITYDITDIIILILAILAVVGLIIYRNKHKRNKR